MSQMSQTSHQRKELNSLADRIEKLSGAESEDIQDLVNSSLPANIAHEAQKILQDNLYKPLKEGELKAKNEKGIRPTVSYVNRLRRKAARETAQFILDNESYRKPHIGPATYHSPQTKRRVTLRSRGFTGSEPNEEGEPTPENDIPNHQYNTMHERHKDSPIELL